MGHLAKVYARRSKWGPVRNGGSFFFIGMRIRRFLYSVPEIENMQELKLSRIWEMPNKNTFDVRCIKEFIMRYYDKDLFSIDPFANKNTLATVTNDLDPEMPTHHHMDALEFLKTFENESVDLVLFDPPYSPRQVSESYKRLGKSVNMETTQSSFWSKMKIEVARITKPNGIVLCFGWSTNGIGKTRGFELIEIQLVAHGGAHNDTICTAERKVG